MLRELEFEEGRSEVVDRSVAETPVTPEEMFRAIMTPLEVAYKMACGDGTTKTKESGGYVFRDYAAQVIPRIARLKQHTDDGEGQRYAVLAVQQITEWLAEIRAVHGEGGELIPGHNALLYERLDAMRLEVGEVGKGTELGSRHGRAVDLKEVVGDAAGERDPVGETHEAMTASLSAGREGVRLEGVAEGTASGDKKKEQSTRWYNVDPKVAE